MSDASETLHLDPEVQQLLYRYMSDSNMLGFQLKNRAVLPINPADPVRGSLGGQIIEALEKFSPTKGTVKFRIDVPQGPAYFQVESSCSCTLEDMVGSVSGHRRQILKDMLSSGSVMLHFTIPF